MQLTGFDCNELLETREIGRRVLKCSLIFPLLFNIYAEAMLRDSQGGKNSGVEVAEKLM